MIQWFPGHMHKAQRELRESLSFIDVVVEVLDARAPIASQNPLLSEICAHKPMIKLLNKMDLVDRECLQKVLSDFKAQGIPYLTGEALRKSIIPALLKSCREAAPHRNSAVKPLRICIVGVPNVGKSTLINTLLQKRLLKVGDIPAVTREIKLVRLTDDVQLVDSPGIMMPKVEHAQNALFLAALGSIGAKAMDESEVALGVIEYFLSHYPHALKKRYGLDQLSEDGQAVMEAIALKMGASSKGLVNFSKVGERILKDLRSGALGKVCFIADPVEHVDLQEI